MRWFAVLILSLTGFVLATGSAADARSRYRHHRRAAPCYEELRACGRNQTNPNQCMACNAVREALNQGLEGMVQVNQTVIARMQSGLFSSTICEVIYEPSQFSWTRSPRTCVSHENWELAKKSVRIAMKRGSNAKLFYHANYVRPRWSRRCVGRRQVGDHIFYGMCGSRQKLAEYNRKIRDRITAVRQPMQTSMQTRMQTPIETVEGVERSEYRRIPNYSGTVQ